MKVKWLSVIIPSLHCPAMGTKGATFTSEGWPKGHDLARSGLNEERKRQVDCRRKKKAKELEDNDKNGNGNGNFGDENSIGNVENGSVETIASETIRNTEANLKPVVPEVQEYYCANCDGLLNEGEIHCHTVSDCR